ncbi:hypothetical protein EIP86_008000 [Pleurotus ostreatoroseus]|nr:hypothetical protein EIP86_008000 [Pleurotus ostreatoroseus]
MPRPPRLLSLWLFLLLVGAANALHFYLDADEKRCFLEEVPGDTVVEGHYKALEWSEHEQKYIDKESLGILVVVVDVNTGHEVVRTRGPSESRFTFTTQEAGDHAICLQSTSGTAWGTNTHIRLYFDIVVGNAKSDREHDRSHVTELSQKLRDLNQKLEDVRREQQYQREREANFRDLSEVTNSRAVWYSIAQIIVIVATCTWQLRHLKRFFEERKM